VEYKRPAGTYPLRDFHKICRIYTPFQDALAVKISLDLLKGFMELWGFYVDGVWLPPKFSAPPSSEIMRQIPRVLDAQERARGPLSPCQVWWGSDFIRRWGSQNVEFLSVCLFVCLSVTLLNVSLCARFHHEGVGVEKIEKRF